MKELFHRTSIRKFTAEPVAREDLLTILRAGMQAPSATNQQPWEFYVVTDRQTLKDLAGASPYGAFTADAAAAIVCCYRTDVRVPQFCEIDCAICMENIWLATDSLGLGGTWIGIAPLYAFLDYIGCLIWALIVGVAGYFCGRVELYKTMFDIQTYKEILAFQQGADLSTLSAVRAERNVVKHRASKAAMAIVAALIGGVCAYGGMWLLDNFGVF